MVIPSVPAPAAMSDLFGLLDVIRSPEAYAAKLAEMQAATDALSAAITENGASAERAQAAAAAAAKAEAESAGVLADAERAKTKAKIALEEANDAEKQARQRRDEVEEQARANAEILAERENAIVRKVRELEMREEQVTAAEQRVRVKEADLDAKLAKIRSLQMD
jgi:hypothetical protein